MVACCKLLFAIACSCCKYNAHQDWIGSLLLTFFFQNNSVKSFGMECQRYNGDNTLMFSTVGRARHDLGGMHA